MRNWFMACPFCKEEEFDHLGMHIHLFGGYCKDASEERVRELDDDAYRQESINLDDRGNEQ